MTSQESQQIYSSFEEFMAEDKLPPVFPSSQSSNVSETPALSQHLISEVCDRDIYGPFGIGHVDDDLPSNFVNSSLAYSPNSLPPRSPSDDSSLYNISSDNSSSFDPSDENSTLIDDMMESTDELSDEFVVVSDVPLLDKDELMQYLDNIALDDINEDFDNFPHEESTPSTSSVNDETPTFLYIKQEATSSNNSSIAPNEEAISFNSSISQNDETKESSFSPVCSKKPATRGRKRKLFSNGGEKKKDQNKEAARRYREKKKQEDARLEAEADELLIKQAELRRELAEITRAHSEFVNLAKQLLQSKRKKE